MAARDAECQPPEARTLFRWPTEDFSPDLTAISATRKHFLRSYPDGASTFPALAGALRRAPREPPGEPGLGRRIPLTRGEPGFRIGRARGDAAALPRFGFSAGAPCARRRARRGGSLRRGNPRPPRRRARTTAGTATGRPAAPRRIPLPRPAPRSRRTGLRRRGRRRGAARRAGVLEGGRRPAAGGTPPPRRPRLPGAPRALAAPRRRPRSAALAGAAAARP